MAPVRNGAVIYNHVPIGYPSPGETTVYDDNRTIDLDNVALNGSMLVKLLVLSVDPYMRSRMREPHIKSYLPPYTLGEPMTGRCIGVVLRSEHENYAPGDHIMGIVNFEEYTIPSDPTSLRKIIREPGLDWPVYLGAAGMPGKSAYYPWKKYAQAKKGDTVFVTGGGGPVGTMVIQLAKMDGMKVIASAGTEEKVQECRDMGADVAFNYNKVNMSEVLEKEGPWDVFWDNVGGGVFDMALIHAALDARVIVCGMISTYNKNPDEGVVLRNLQMIIAKSLHIHGFLVSRLSTPELEDEFYSTIPKKVASGELKHREDITRGLENTGEALLDVLKGRNFGKKVVLVAEE
ncbi:NAD(P)-binding protein [Marasmius fiardii PR-910]|nr:NAD(P)-binding protein [Marasmius fiardii PR-910]